MAHRLYANYVALLFLLYGRELLPSHRSVFIRLQNRDNVMNESKNLELENAINDNCPWSGNPIDENSLTTYKGKIVGFCNPGCRDKFDKAVDLFESLLLAP